MSYRFVMENGKLQAVPAKAETTRPLRTKLYAVGTRVLFPRAVESTQTIAVAVI